MQNINFLDANIEDRAKRRFREFSSYGEKITYQEVINQLKKRDRLDSTRKISPLIRSKDAILIDTSKLTIEQQIEKSSVLLRVKLIDKETNINDK